MSRSFKIGIQLESCGICGRAVPQDRLFVSNVQGLRGFKICDQHGSIGSLPSYDDMRRMGPRLPVPDVARKQPTGYDLSLYSDDDPSIGGGGGPPPPTT